MRLFALVSGMAGALMFTSTAFAQAAAEAPAATEAPAVSAAPVQASAIKPRTAVWSKKGGQIGPVIAVTPAADGSVGFVTVIVGESSVRVPGATLSMDGSKLVSSLTRREAAKLR